MSEPSETSGRPLAPTINQEQQPEGNPIKLPSSTRLKHRKSSYSLDGCSEASKSTNTCRRLETTIKAPSNPHAGSSRSEQRSTTSPTKMMSQTHSIKITRTGRISKAKKGLKVHNCWCGRSYTRAEHLRRHQKNHAQDDALVCDYPDCGKTFYRIDLLHRHQERHAEPGRDSRQPSIFSPEGSPEARQASVPVTIPASITTTTLASAPPYYSPQPVSPMHTPATIPSDKHRHSYIGRQSMAVPMVVDGITPPRGRVEPCSQSPGYSSSSGHASPNPGPGDYPNVFAPLHYGHGVNRERTSSNASFIDQWSFMPRSPTSSASTLPYTWASNDKTSHALSLAYMGTSYPMASLGISTTMDPMSGYGQYDPKTMMQRDEDESEILFPQQPYGMGQIEHTYSYEQCLNVYWRLFHPTLPVVHRSTFESLSPMLRAAMISIGGQYSNDTSAKRKSRILHDRCIKLLEKRERERMTEPDRLCDYQAVFLVEVLSQYRARRAAKQLSPRFGTLYHKAAENFRLMSSQSGDIVVSLARRENVTRSRWFQWIELGTWHRLLVSCYMLESQQAMLLAREPLPSLFQDSGIDLPFPAHSHVWDAPTLNDWAVAAQQYSASPQYLYEVTQESVIVPCDSFQSALLIAVYYNRFNSSAPYANPPSMEEIDHLLDGSFVTKQKLLTAKLLQVTPVRALLAVSGESWILSEKVPSQQAFITLRTTLRTWLTQLWSRPTLGSQPMPIKEAIKLSIEILQLALSEQSEAFALEMGPDMGLYFAALVLWAATTALTTRMQEPEQAPQHIPHGHHSQSPSFINYHGSISVPSTPTQLPSAFSNHATMTSSPIQSTIPEFAHSQPVSPIRHDTLAATTLLSHEKITCNSISFLPVILGLASAELMTHSHVMDLANLQAGCISMLLWVKLQLHGAPLEDQTDLAVWTSRPGEGLGELLDSVVGSLERVLNRGWTGWRI